MSYATNEPTHWDAHAEQDDFVAPAGQAPPQNAAIFSPRTSYSGELAAQALLAQALQSPGGLLRAMGLTCALWSSMERTGRRTLLASLLARQARTSLDDARAALGFVPAPPMAAPPGTLLSGWRSTGERIEAAIDAYCRSYGGHGVRKFSGRPAGSVEPDDGRRAALHPAPDPGSYPTAASIYRAASLDSVRPAGQSDWTQGSFNREQAAQEQARAQWLATYGPGAGQAGTPAQNAVNQQMAGGGLSQQTQTALVGMGTEGIRAIGTAITTAMQQGNETERARILANAQQFIASRNAAGIADPTAQAAMMQLQVQLAQAQATAAAQQANQTPNTQTLLTFGALLALGVGGVYFVTKSQPKHNPVVKRHGKSMWVPMSRLRPGDVPVR